MEVTVLSLTSDLQANRALPQTQESLIVTQDSGSATVPHNESTHTGDITMCRGSLPGHPLHEWFVVSYNREPGFDCIGFDKANGITP